MQGRWQVLGSTPCIDKDVKLPVEVGLTDTGSLLVVQGNQLTCNGKVVAALTNDLASSALNAEKGFKEFRLLVLTLPSGKGLLCSYSITEDGVEIAYPHTTACHRGSGQIVYLKRAAPAKVE